MGGRPRYSPLRLSIVTCCALALAIILTPTAAWTTAAAEEVADADPAPQLTLIAAPGRVTFNGRAQLTAAVGIPNASLQLSARRGDEAAFRPLRVVKVGADGRAWWTARPRVTTTYRIQLVDDPAVGAAAAETTVAVRARITLSSAKAVHAGQRITFRTLVRPWRPGAGMELQIRRGGEWVLLRRFTLDRRSRATVGWRSDRRGLWRFRIVMSADARHAGGASPSRRVRVKSANPYGVPVREPRFIVVDRSQFKLYYHERGRIVRVFDCVLGKPSTPTPRGRFRVYGRGINPGGPFGVRVLWYHRGYGIHGTNQPWLLRRSRRAFSLGCTRLANRDALWLFDRCPAGTRVWNVR